MIPLLAQLDPANSTVVTAAVLFAIFSLAGGVNQVLKITDRFKEHPPASQTYQPKGDYATRAELSQLRTELTEQISDLDRDIGYLREQLHSDMKAIQKAGEDRAGKIHERINVVLEKVAELKGRMND
jgi:hypothetical protein